MKTPKVGVEPKEIYLQVDDKINFIPFEFSRKPRGEEMGYRNVKYIRADLAKKELKEAVEVAEDHAMLAGRIQMEAEIRANSFRGLTWRDIQDIWFITDDVLKSIPADFTKREEWMFSTQGRFTKALEKIKKYEKEKDGNKD